MRGHSAFFVRLRGLPLKVYAAEAGRALIEYGFRALSLKRIVATTTYDNEASIAVMRKIGMAVHRNPYSEPPWMQIVAVRESGMSPFAAR